MMSNPMLKGTPASSLESVSVAGPGELLTTAGKPTKVASPKVIDPEAYGGPGATPEVRIAAAIGSLPLLVVGKSWCPFCAEALEVLVRHGASPSVINVDTAHGGAALHHALKASTGQATVPYIYLGGKLIGGCSDLKALDGASGLDSALHAAHALEGVGGSATRARDMQLPAPEPPAASPDAPAVYHPLLNFPDTVDGHVIRGVALQICAVAIAIIVLRNTAAGRWLAVATLIDFLLRFTAGSQASPLGVISIAAVARMRPVWGAGAPKQFAAFVGICFASAGVAATWADPSEEKVGAAVVWAVLAFFAALEGFLNFCAGCWVFGQR